MFSIQSQSHLMSHIYLLKESVGTKEVDVTVSYLIKEKNDVNKNLLSPIERRPLSGDTKALGNSSFPPQPNIPNIPNIVCITSLYDMFC